MRNILRATIISCILLQLASAVPAKKADTNDTRSDADKVGALLIVVAFGALGGFIVAAI